MAGVASYPYSPLLGCIDVSTRMEESKQNSNNCRFKFYLIMGKHILGSSQRVSNGHYNLDFLSSKLSRKEEADIQILNGKPRLSKVSRLKIKQC